MDTVSTACMSRKPASDSTRRGPDRSVCEGDCRQYRLVRRAVRYRIGDPKADLSLDDRENAGSIPKCVVVDQAFTWGGDQLLRTPWDRTVIYEVHVHGFTARHPDVPKNLRGTYAGLATPEVIEHLQQVGVTAVELLPVHHFVRDKHLIDRGLTNYWGYNSIGFFAPDIRYATSPERAHHVWEFKTMVKALHNAGIEVILDVVYNHTGKGNHLGPTLSFRGIDNASYYRLVPDHPRFYQDYTGCGNTLNVRHPRVLQLIMDSLRYWVLEMHVDGFRFDLASTLARELHDVDRLSAFFDIIHQDPVLSQVKLIAEPWDLGKAATRSATFRPAGPSGTAGIATRSGDTGKATGDKWRSWPIGSPEAAISTKAAAAGLTPALIL